MLTVEAVTKNYGQFTALKDFSLDFEQGVYALLAPNGAGKTTLLKMLATLLFPTKGRIVWEGEDIFKLDAAYREKVGYLPQQFGFYKHQSPRQFLRYLAALKGIDKAEAEKRIPALMQMVFLEDAIDKKMRKFSGGMLQRVGIAQAMLNDPGLLILDEPTAGLDPKERVRFRNIIHTLARDRIVILSTHIVSDVESVADQIVMIKDHRLFCCETSAQICERLKGKVFEVPAGSPLAEGDVFLSERQAEGGTVLRFYSESAPQGARAVQAGLEDAFLYLYRDEREGEA